MLVGFESLTKADYVGFDVLNAETVATWLYCLLWFADMRTPVELSLVGKNIVS